MHGRRDRLRYGMGNERSEGLSVTGLPVNVAAANLSEIVRPKAGVGGRRKGCVGHDGMFHLGPEGVTGYRVPPLETVSGMQGGEGGKGGVRGREKGRVGRRGGLMHLWGGGVQACDVGQMGNEKQESKKYVSQRGGGGRVVDAEV